MIGGRDVAFGREITTARRFSRHPFRLQSIRIRTANDIVTGQTLSLGKQKFKFEPQGPLSLSIFSTLISSSR